jgi:DoxX.
MNIVLWIIQALLALLFLFTGGMKLVLSIDQIQAMGSPNQIVLPALLVRFIGLCEVLGALGLILPGLFRIRPGLTPLAAAGLIIIMVGAAAMTLKNGAVPPALFALVVGFLAAFVVYGRLKLAPQRGR